MRHQWDVAKRVIWRNSFWRIRIPFTGPQTTTVYLVWYLKYEVFCKWTVNREGAEGSGCTKLRSISEWMSVIIFSRIIKCAKEREVISFKTIWSVDSIRFWKWNTFNKYQFIIIQCVYTLLDLLKIVNVCMGYFWGMFEPYAKYITNLVSTRLDTCNQRCYYSQIPSKWYRNL